ncbi:2,4-dichlorophenol 6-monooxygenase [Heracleum sosnowskyi]|uniref:2,4-dichlorophenol 6-monooxygenase n=1 Tax=Heracleum sosnowskyi TaxID=360622 RepID=A0AAD8MAI7_9APIA|nr:2,4-dichlorophenol 6-monooxygenase [Heracleum sosnowskyi]
MLPVLIVGAGPVGLALSLLLTKLGVKCAVVEKNLSFSRHPQAHFINNRSMEVFRKLDGLADQIQKFQPPVELWRKFVYCTSLTGPVIGSVDHMQPQDLDQTVSPVSVAHFSQYKLTRLILQHLQNLGFTVRNPNGLDNLKYSGLKEREILMGHECVSVNATSDCVTMTASFLNEEGKHSVKCIRSRLLVGTDGAGSTVRQLLGINMRGEKDLQKLVSVHFMSKKLGEYLMNERPGMLFFIFNTEAIGVLVAHDLKEGEFVLQIPFYPPQQKLEDFSSKICERLIAKLAGRELEDIKVVDIKPWVMHAEVSEKYLSHDNRIIIAGDAAHRFPPAGGFGMNTGIQDVHNLAWKIASVVKGTAPKSILTTYEAERRPVAIFNTELSVKNFRAAMGVPAALGLDPVMANSVHSALNNTVGSILPSELQRKILDGIFTLGRAQLSNIVLNKNNPVGSSRLANVRRIFEGGESLQLQFPAEDLGFRYLEGALSIDDEIETELEEPEVPTGRRREYVPSADPGSRLPHTNVKVLSGPSIEETFSTLDLVSGDKVEFLLIIAPVEPSYRLARAAFEVAEEYNVSAKVCVLWPDGTVDGAARSAAELTPWENFIDVVEVKRSSASSSWWDLCQMTHKGAILVRPDEHIAWRVKSGVVGDTTFEFRRVFSAILGLTNISESDFKEWKELAIPNTLEYGWDL